MNLKSQTLFNSLGMGKKIDVKFVVDMSVLKSSSESKISGFGMMTVCRTFSALRLDVV